MGQLKQQILREIATDLCGRDQSFFFNNNGGLRNLERFVLAGKEEFRVFRRIVENDITITEVTPRSVAVKYRIESWRHEHSFLEILILMWARKLHLHSFENLDIIKLGYSRVLAVNTDFEELQIDGVREWNAWPDVLKAFPKLTVLRVNVQHFPSTLAVAPSKHVCLKEVGISGGGQAGELLAAHKALSKHQKKLPFLDTIHYVNMLLKEITFPDDAGNVLSIKRLKIDVDVDWDDPFNVSCMQGVTKLFPSLKKAEINAHKKMERLRKAYS